MENLKSPYDWYKLSEKARSRLFLKNETFVIENGLYLPVLWANKNINYNEPYGLLCFPKIYGRLYNKNYKGIKWFGLRVFSPDDWDCDLDITLNDGMTDQEADVQYNELIRITKNYVSTVPANPTELFTMIHISFVEKYPNTNIIRGY